jgi:hypothetical protein
MKGIFSSLVVDTATGERSSITVNHLADDNNANCTSRSYVGPNVVVEHVRGLETD